MTRSHAPGVRGRLTWTICSELPLPCFSSSITERPRWEQGSATTGVGWPWSPKPAHPKTSFHLFTFLDLKNTCLNLLVMIKAHDKDGKTGVLEWNPKRKVLNQAPGAQDHWRGDPPTMYLLVYSESNAYCHGGKSAKKNRMVYTLKYKWSHANS